MKRFRFQAASVQKPSKLIISLDNEAFFVSSIVSVARIVKSKLYTFVWYRLLKETFKIRLEFFLNLCSTLSNVFHSFLTTAGISSWCVNHNQISIL